MFPSRLGRGVGGIPDKILKFYALLCIFYAFHAFETRFSSFFLEKLFTDALDTEHSRFSRLTSAGFWQTTFSTDSLLAQKIH